MRPRRHALASGGAGDLRDYAQAAPGGFLSPDAQPKRLQSHAACAAVVRGGAPEGADEGDMFVRDSGREKTREAAIAALRDRFGPTAVQRGLTFRPAPPTK
jgi:hypothetical protein